MTETKLDDMERAACNGDSPLHQMLREAVIEIRKLNYELADPNYFYAGSRIGRQAILSRNWQIDKLFEQVKKLKGEES